ncbi:MAG: hypothetical protein IT406_03105, partial [Candidatus Yanofskybacteria bacterium]|nr:hypothetical protein [Candidatus Yanofskybacteria bacterium]
MPALLTDCGEPTALEPDVAVPDQVQATLAVKPVQIRHAAAAVDLDHSSQGDDGKLELEERVLDADPEEFLEGGGTQPLAV